jgi:riboflavin synthase alpha subunit
MFTGIIEATADVERVEPHGGGTRLALATQRPLDGLALGESIAVSGACLTVTEPTRPAVHGRRCRRRRCGERRSAPSPPAIA